MRTSESVVCTRYCPTFPAKDPDHHPLQPLDCAAASSAALIVIQYDRNDLAANEAAELKASMLERDASQQKDEWFN